MADIPGKYIHEKTGSHYIELKPDGSYFLFDGSRGITGTYDVDGSEIKIFVGESASHGQIQNGVIVDDEGEKWVCTQASAVGSDTTKVLNCRNCNSALLETAKFCSNCGAQVGEVEPISTKRIQAATRGATQAQSTRHDLPTSDDPLTSMFWLPAVLRREDFPWELIEAAGWAVIMIAIFVIAFREKP
jgi:hypothetical protein